MTQEAIFEKHFCHLLLKKYKNTDAPGMKVSSSFIPALLETLFLNNQLLTVRA